MQGTKTGGRTPSGGRREKKLPLRNNMARGGLSLTDVYRRHNKIKQVPDHTPSATDPGTPYHAAGNVAVTSLRTHVSYHSAPYYPLYHLPPGSFVKSSLMSVKKNEQTNCCPVAECHAEPAIYFAPTKQQSEHKSYQLEYIAYIYPVMCVRIILRTRQQLRNWLNWLNFCTK